MSGACAKEELKLHSVSGWLAAGRGSRSLERCPKSRFLFPRSGDLRLTFPDRA
jgi:hypothetical protein